MWNYVPSLELTVATTDDPKPQRALQTSKPAGRRPVSARDYRMPKPYRRPVFADEIRVLSRRQIVLLCGTTVAVAGLIFTLALLARNHPDPVPIAVELETPATLVPVKMVRRTPKRRVAVRVPPATVAIAAGHDSHPAPLDARPPFKLLIPAAPSLPGSTPALAAAVPEPDPDVDLIATILTLFPPAAAERTPVPPPCIVTAEKGDGCEALQAVQR